MATIEMKWTELIGFATQHATGKGMQTGIKWLEDSFNEYLALSDATPSYSMGGQPGSEHNRQVLAQKVLQELGNGVGGRHLLDEQQSAHLKDSLQTIAKNAVTGIG